MKLDLTKLRPKSELSQQSVFMTPKTHNKLRAAAKAAGVPMYKIVEALVDQYLPEVPDGQA
jgi:hypothetical protein